MAPEVDNGHVAEPNESAVEEGLVSGLLLTLPLLGFRVLGCEFFACCSTQALLRFAGLQPNTTEFRYCCNDVGVQSTGVQPKINNCKALPIARSSASGNHRVMDEVRLLGRPLG
jgi:hypothetical protein